HGRRKRSHDEQAWHDVQRTKLLEGNYKSKIGQAEYKQTPCKEPWLGPSTMHFVNGRSCGSGAHDQVCFHFFDAPPFERLGKHFPETKALQLFGSRDPVERGSHLAQ